jgi:hypothetical protein
MCNATPFSYNYFNDIFGNLNKDHKSTRALLLNTAYFGILTTMKPDAMTRILSRHKSVAVGQSRT